MSSCFENCECDFDKTMVIINDASIDEYLKDLKKTRFDIGFGEPAGSDEDFYRLFLKSAFNLESRVFNLYLNNKTPFLEVKYYNKIVEQNGRESYIDSLSRNEKYFISNDQLKELRSNFAKTCFWTQETYDDPTLDANSFLLEGFKKNVDPCSRRKYHLVLRNRHDLEMESICNLILDLANTSLSKQYKDLKPDRY